MATIRRIVVLEFSQDFEPGLAKLPEWWEALGLPPPEYWPERFPESHIRVQLERTVAY
jgi:hypothetical protein